MADVKNSDEVDAFNLKDGSRIGLSSKITEVAALKQDFRLSSQALAERAARQAPTGSTGHAAAAKASRTGAVLGA